MDRRHILLLDVVLVVGSLLIVAAFVGYTQPLVIAPLDEFVTTETAVLFSFENAHTILIDDNLDFTSPRVFAVSDRATITLTPGTYYWKLEGIIESEVRTLTVQSKIDLFVRKSNTIDEYEVVNAGNTPLNVEVYENGTLVDNVILDIDEHTGVSGAEIIGSQNE